MNTVKYKIKIQALVILVLMAVLSSCNHDKKHPGYAYMPDMYYSEAYNANSENPVFRNKITNQMPVPGTIARGHIPYPYQAKNYFDQIAAGNELLNPIEANLQTLSEGKAQYEIFCMSCHGEQGDGNGYLYTSKLYAMKPTSLIESYIQDKKDGEIFHIITVGSLSGLMGAHGSQINAENRWKIINYVRNDLAKK
jgi:mono/diheme cytochrome c family protein